jgi:hypothetical protein
MGKWITSAHGVEVYTTWLLGYPNEDDAVLAGRCPLTGGDRHEQICGAARSDDRRDWPYCQPHAERARDER